MNFLMFGLENSGKLLCRLEDLDKVEFHKDETSSVYIYGMGHGLYKVLLTEDQFMELAALIDNYGSDPDDDDSDNDEFEIFNDEYDGDLDEYDDYLDDNGDDTDDDS